MRRLLHAGLAIALLWLVACAPAQATRAAASQLAREAKDLLDAHYGLPDTLGKSARILKRALAEDESNADVWLQMARLAIKGGHVADTRFRAGTVEAYGELLDRALALDPKSTKAHILKAEYFSLRGDFAAEWNELEQARRLGTSDSWLLIGYGRHYANVRDYPKAIARYEQVRARGRGTTLEQRNALVAALGGLAGFASSARDKTALRSIVAETRKARDPRDAWAIGNLAHSMFGGLSPLWTVLLARVLLQERLTPAARLTLACALYGKAAQAEMKGDRAASGKLAGEAKALGFDRGLLLQRFEELGPVYANQMPALKRLID